MVDMGHKNQKKIIYILIYMSKKAWGGAPRGVNGLKRRDCGIVVSEFVLQFSLLRSLSDKYTWESL